MDPDVPLVVPEVNRAAIKGYTARNIIANPNCSTIQMVGGAEADPRRRDHQARGRVDLSVDPRGAGKEAMDELLTQTKSFFVNQELEPKKLRQETSPFNVIPQIDTFMEDGFDQGRVEDDGRDQEDPRSQDQGARHLRTGAHSRGPMRKAVTVELEQPLDDVEARRLLAAMPGILVVDRRELGGYVTPKEIVGSGPGVREPP